MTATIPIASQASAPLRALPPSAMVPPMPERLEGTVDRIRFVNDETHWTVAQVRADGAVRPVVVVGTMPGLQEGMRVRLDGDWVDDPRFGRQFRGERFTELIPATADGLKQYLKEHIPGIGPKTAERLVERFGPATLDIIMREPARLEDVPRLGPKQIERITQALQERRGGQEALIFLHGLQIPPGLANKIFKCYGDDTVTRVRTNPYRLAEDVHGVGFHKADQVARGLGIAGDHPARARAGAYHVLLEARSEGHCFLPRSALTEATRHLLGGQDADVDGAITQLVMAGRVVVEANVLTDGDPNDDLVYLRGLHEAELGVARHLAVLVGDGGAAPLDGDPEARVAQAAARLGIDLARGQTAAVKLALGYRTAIVTGGPGTGKTTIIRTLLEAFGLPADKVALAAPTGRAAKRMTESTGLEAKTIHRLLEFAPHEGGFQRHEEDPLDAELVIIDEASMLDLPLFHALVRAIPVGARLVLVGDVDQLPPVGPGAPFTDLIRGGSVPVARLTEIFRQGRGSAIVDSAHRINHGEVPEPTGAGTPLQDFYFIARESPEDILATIEEVVARRLAKSFGLDPIADVQVLAPMRGGPIGVDHLNLRLQALLNPAGAETPEVTVGGTTYRLGDKVMQIRNDYERGVFNGDMGRVCRVDDDGLGVAIDGREVRYERRQLDDLVLAYAVSVHKSQGSEYPAVVMPVSTQHFKMLQRNLMYTGVTRGKRLVVLVGTAKAMHIAVARSEVARRNTLLAERLKAAQKELTRA